MKGSEKDKKIEHVCCASSVCTMARFAREAGFTCEDVKYYKSDCELLFIEPGEFIFHQFGIAEGIFCLQTGNVMLWHLDELGNEIGFRVAGEGDIVGHRACFGEDPHAASAVALTDCVVCHLHKHTLTLLMDKYPALPRLFLRLLARDRGPPDSLMLRNTYLPVKVRLINLLMILKRSVAVQDNNGVLVFELPISRREISTMIATRPETVTRIIGELNRDGLVHFKERTITIPDMERLKEAATEHEVY